MIHRHLPSDPRIVDEVFSVATMPGLEEVGWLMGMIATYGKTPEDLEGFSWNDDGSININSKKRAVRPLHPQWVFLFQLREKQPSKTKSKWSKLCKQLDKTLSGQRFNVSVEGLILAHKVRKVYYTPISRQPEQKLVTA
tara:strand:- start:388 stop:804 length:417 start_codon:yes stop_codon:yes gene_type:complete